MIFSELHLIFNLILSLLRNPPSTTQKTLLSLTVDSVSGSASNTVMICGVINASSVTWDATSASWNAMSNFSQSGLQILLPLASGTPITQITQNFVNWWSPRNVVIVGHLTGTYGQTNQQRQIDVTDYVNEVVSGGGSGGGQTTLTFFMFRPFRHPSYMTGMGSGPGLTPSGINVTMDNLAAGSLIQIASAGSATPP